MKFRIFRREIIILATFIGFVAIFIVIFKMISKEKPILALSPKPIERNKVLSGSLEKISKEKPVLALSPTPIELNEVLSGSLALVEAQHTYYVHMMGNSRFATNVHELGPQENTDGAIMVRSVFNASDAVPTPSPVHGYLFKIIPFINDPNQKDGFVVLAYPADASHDSQGWPIFVSIIPNAKGGIFGMAARDTWEINDMKAAKELRALLGRKKLSMKDLEKFSHENFPNSQLIKSFKIKEQ